MRQASARLRRRSSSAMTDILELERKLQNSADRLELGGSRFWISPTSEHGCHQYDSGHGRGDREQLAIAVGLSEAGAGCRAQCSTHEYSGNEEGGRGPAG